MRLIYHPSAEAELIEAAKFYEGRVPNLGLQFLEASDRALSVILQAPERWRIIEADVRRYSMRRCPFSIYYRVLEDLIGRSQQTAGRSDASAGICEKLLDVREAVSHYRPLGFVSLGSPFA